MPDRREITHSEPESNAVRGSRFEKKGGYPSSATPYGEPRFAPVAVSGPFTPGQLRLTEPLLVLEAGVSGGCHAATPGLATAR